MTTYLPEGVDLRRAGYDYDPDQEPVAVYGVTPLVDPLTPDPCPSRRKAAEHVAQHIEAASLEPNTWVLQWHATCIEIHPYTISEADFQRLWVEYYPMGGEFPTPAHLDDFLYVIETKLKEVEPWD